MRIIRHNRKLSYNLIVVVYSHAYPRVIFTYKTKTHVTYHMYDSISNWNDIQYLRCQFM